MHVIRLLFIIKVSQAYHRQLQLNSLKVHTAHITQSVVQGGQEDLVALLSLRIRSSMLP